MDDVVVRVFPDDAEEVQGCNFPDFRVGKAELVGDSLPVPKGKKFRMRLKVLVGRKEALKRMKAPPEVPIGGARLSVLLRDVDVAPMLRSPAVRADPPVGERGNFSFPPGGMSQEQKSSQEKRR